MADSKRGSIFCIEGGRTIRSSSATAQFSEVHRPKPGRLGKTSVPGGCLGEVTISPTPSEPGTAGKAEGFSGYTPSKIFLSAGLIGEYSHFTEVDDDSVFTEGGVFVYDSTFSGRPNEL